MRNYFATLKSWLSAPIDPHVISLFRIIYGLFMCYEMIDYFRIGLIRNMFVLPKINFQYDFLRWLKPLPETGMNAILIVLLICAFAITFGVLMKWACRLFALGYAYIFLLDKSIYNNHIYLFILLAILLSFTQADQLWALGKKSASLPKIPRWQQFILQFQIIIVYFYGGIAKLNYDWLIHRQPVKLLISHIPESHLLAPLIKNEFGVFLLTYGGFLLDFGAPFLLWYKPVRKWSLIPIIIFHVFNSIIFTDIGIFPYIMMMSLILFFEPDEIPFIRTLIGHRVIRQTKRKKGSDTLPETQPGVRILIISYFIFQLAFPLRGFLLPNDMDWTTIGNRFSWRMKVNTREMKEMKFLIYDQDKRDSLSVDISTFINNMQILNMSMDPRSIADFADLLKQTVKERGMEDVAVYAKLIVSYNGRAPQYFVKPDEDLSSVNYQPFKPLNWVYPVLEK